MMKVGELRRLLANPGVGDDVEVLVRVQDDEGEVMVGGVFSAELDAGCTDTAVFMLDACTADEDGEDLFAEAPRNEEGNEEGVGELSFFVDPVHGSDETGDGTLARPFKTCRPIVVRTTRSTESSDSPTGGS